MNSKTHNSQEMEEYKDKSKLKYIMPSKKFEKRQSLLVSMFENNAHCRAGYNIIISFSLFIMFTLNLKEYIKNNRLSPAIHLIYEKFGKLHIVFVTWIVMNIFACLFYYFFMWWVKLRRRVFNKTQFDKLCILLLAFCYGSTFYGIHLLIFRLNIPFASGMIVLCETVRFLIKIHAFIRSNAPKVLISNSDKENIKLPTFFQYGYFVYIPSAVYRDEYPRTENIRWCFVFYRFLEVLWSILCLAHFYTYLATPLFQDVCKRPMNWMDFWLLHLQISVPALLMLWLTFFPTIHATQNAVGEMLKFGDRMFYSDWWNSKDMQEFYKKWNWVIGDWLYTYVNKDLGEVVFPDKRNLAKLLTIIISALVHEWIIICASGFICPIITFMMLFSMILVKLKVKSDRNYVLLINFFLLPIGPGTIATFLFLELFARQNLPTKTNEIFVFWNNCFT